MIREPAVRAVLLVPDEGDPLDLLGLKASPFSKLGGRLPTAERTREYPECPIPSDAPPEDPSWWTDWRGSTRDNHRGMIDAFGSDYERALVLVWDGEVVPHGLLSAWLHAWTGGNEAEVDSSIFDMDAHDIIEAVSTWRHDGKPLGTIVVLGELAAK